MGIWLGLHWVLFYFFDHYIQSSVIHARGYLAWTSLGIILFLRSLYSKFSSSTTTCTWPWVVPIGEDPAARGHWCAFTDLYHTMGVLPSTIPYLVQFASFFDDYIQSLVRVHKFACIRARPKNQLTIIIINKKGPAGAGRPCRSEIYNKPTWQLFAPAWHVPLWSDDFSPFRFQVCLLCDCARLVTQL